MTKQEHIDYWIQSSNVEFEVFNVLLKNTIYSHALFIANLCLEKLVKAHYVKDNSGNVAPKVHNLVFLVKNTNLKLTDEQMNFFAIFNDFQIQGRYPDYKFKIKQLLTKDYIDTLVSQFKEIRKCLLEMIT